MEREPGKRRIKPSQNFLDFEDLGESSDDSDFRIEDHENGSDDDSNFDSDKSSDSGPDSGSDDEDDDEDGDEIKDSKKSKGESLSVNDVLSQAEKSKIAKDVSKIIICCVCLGEHSSDQNEIIECDCCGVTVHEGCYGVPDATSVSSSHSSCSTEPWFCEACQAGVDNPVCELCPNIGGIYKETDVGKWVHLVCALYIPGVAFGEVDKLSNITLSELPFSKWGSKVCQHCQDSRFSRTGVCLQCDAGMCRAYFHVTCGQREGLLTEAPAEEADQADPFYANCKLHCDKTQARSKKRNWMALQFRTNEIRKQNREEVVQNWERIQRKLTKYRSSYAVAKGKQPQPWIPTQKRPRMLTSSANACRLLWKKAECMGIDTATLEAMDMHIASLMDVPKKWHLQPAFSVEFVGYYLDRNSRIDSLKKQLATTVETNSKLIKQQESMQVQYDQAVKANADIVSKNKALKEILQTYHSVISNVCPTKKLPDLEILSRPVANVEVASAQSANAKGTMGYPLGFVKQAVISKKAHQLAPIPDTPVLLDSKCGICHKSNDQHLLAKCDTCHLYYHLGCLNPPLTSMPKKTKLYGWQCSECDKDSSGSEMENVDTEAPRKLRQIIKDNDKHSQFLEFSDTSKTATPASSVPGSPEASNKKPANGVLEAVSGGVKRKKVKQRNDSLSSPNSVDATQNTKPRKKRKRMESSDVDESPQQPRQHIKILIKSIPSREGNATSPQLFVASANSSVSSLQSSPATSIAPSAPVIPVVPARPARQPKPKPEKKIEQMNDCDTCSGAGNITNMVSCDECKRCFHFGCLDPPVKKSPKVRGYSWHCANCDPTESDSD
ncbi:unnamed protein product [Bemisia tabaci]|uniref:PHD finger protein 14 n=1 Tax=Bemisia tabaci TaxID=7038 RepID=A0A9P0C7C9_BEMTA|nr:unnamed protein product [Bemisia tabaci]